MVTSDSDDLDERLVVGQDSNLQPSDLRPGALPIELPTIEAPPAGRGYSVVRLPISLDHRVPHDSGDVEPLRQQRTTAGAVLVRAWIPYPAREQNRIGDFDLSGRLWR